MLEKIQIKRIFIHVRIYGLLTSGGRLLGGKFSESTKYQIFGANMCKTIIQELLTLFPRGNMC